MEMLVTTPLDLWVDKNGETHIVSEMKEQHIQNCLRCLEGKGKSKLNFSNYQAAVWKRIFEEELQSRVYQIF